MREIIKFLQEVRTEFFNITWPKKESLIQLTFVVISISLIISLILGGFDFLFTQSLNLLGGTTKNINQNTDSIPAVVTIVPTVGTAPTAYPTINLSKPTDIKK